MTFFDHGEDRRGPTRLSFKTLRLLPSGTVLGVSQSEPVVEACNPGSDSFDENGPSENAGRWRSSTVCPMASSPFSHRVANDARSDPP